MTGRHLPGRSLAMTQLLPGKRTCRGLTAFLVSATALVATGFVLVAGRTLL